MTSTISPFQSLTDIVFEFLQVLCKGRSTPRIPIRTFHKIHSDAYRGSAPSSEANLTVRYEDAFGHEEAFTSAVSITVEEPLPITPPTDDPETSETAAITWILIGLCAVFAIALVVQGILLRGKLHKLEEDKL